MCTGGESNQGPLGLKSDALSTAPLRPSSISYSSDKKKQEEQKEKEIIKKIESLEANLSNNNVNEVENLKEELNNIRKHKMQGILVRSRAQIIEDDEKTY